MKLFQSLYGETVCPPFLYVMFLSGFAVYDLGLHTEHVGKGLARFIKTIIVVAVRVRAVFFPVGALSILDPLAYRNGLLLCLAFQPHYKSNAGDNKNRREDHCFYMVS